MISRGDSDGQICSRVDGRGFRLSVLLCKKTKRQRKEQKLASFAPLNSVWMSNLILKNKSDPALLSKPSCTLVTQVVLFFKK